jgi:hypothetical protein
MRSSDFCALRPSRLRGVPNFVVPLPSRAAPSLFFLDAGAGDEMCAHPQSRTDLARAAACVW